MKQTLFILIALSMFLCTNAQKRTVKKKLSLTETTFYIKNVASGKYLDLPGYATKAKKDNGTNVVLWDHDTGSDRKYEFQSAGGGYYYVLPQHCDSRLDVEGCFPDKWFCNYYKNKNGAPIQIWSFNGKSAHDVGKWSLIEVKKGQFLLYNKYAKKVLDADGNNTNKNGCKVQIWTRNNNNNQLWELIDVKTGQRYEK